MTTTFGSRWIVWPLAAFTFVFLYLPIAAIVVFSFNAGVSVGLPWKGFSLRWYESALSNPDVMAALWNSLVVSVGTVVIAVLLGVPVAIALDRYNFPFKQLFRQLVLLPLILPGIITGVSVLGLYLLLRLDLNLMTLTLALGTSLMCIIITEVFTRLQQMGRNQESAAYDMGASELEVFFRVTLPGISSALVGAMLICFSLAMDELAVSYLLIGQENTLPMYIWSALRRSVSPELNAVATITILISLVTVSAGVWLTQRSRR